MGTTRFTAATVAVVALLASLLAVPASAQTAPEGFEDLQACATAITLFFEFSVDEDDRDTSSVQLNGTTLTVGELLVELEDVSGLAEGDELAVWILENCDTYAIQVLPRVIERDPDPDPSRETVVAGETLTRPAEVLGTSLAVTGADIVILGLFGATLLGLGVLAVRRTRPKVSGPR